MAIVTISRMYGSGGSHVARRVADSLGWNLLDNEVIDAVAHRLGIPAAEVSAREERVPSLVDRIARAISLTVPEMAATMTDSAPSTEERIVSVTKLVIEEALQRGDAVLVGRGAQWMLGNRSDALHVFCYAPRPALIAFATAEHDVSAEAAAKIVDDTNHQREQFVRRYWNRNWRDVENYDLCVNTYALGIEGAAELVVRARQGTFRVTIARPSGTTPFASRDSSERPTRCTLESRRPSRQWPRHRPSARRWSRREASPPPATTRRQQTSRPP